ncbi:DUF2029 domain-containing protein [Glaciihabitans arcticus]|uniref:DUF2029 domain-containing protein n=2 Tax=Glaciihabitans arcticus TaxID=2668039 RepID=A0A4Q9GUP2_9MICO|nr:DUF2029 domain-containing protein [Glaciihabitans arcticus]
MSASRLALWIAFVAVHVWLGLVNLLGPGLPLGDVTITYRFWTDQAFSHDYWVGIDSVWVYPILAILPMLASFAFGPEVYGSTWLTLVMVLNGVAFAFLTRPTFSRERLAIAWWWIAFLLLLGPIALGRIDSVTIPLAVVGVVLLATRPRIAAFILVIATWMKIWPAALLAAIVVSSKHRLATVVVALGTSAAIVLVMFALGGGGAVFSFITQQAGRGLQIEAPVSTAWLWQAAAGANNAYVYYDQGILTFQVTGDGADVAADLMTPLLAVVALAVAALGILAVRRGAAALDVLAPLSLALVTALIAFNKVGSPQFISWLAVPIILGLGARLAGSSVPFRVPAVIVLVIAALTQVLYPYLYVYLLGLNTVLLIVITARNALYFVLLAWAIAELWQVGTRARVGEGGPLSDEPWPETAWPFAPNQRGMI